MLSVVPISYNTYHDLLNTFNSVISQKNQNFELIKFCDDDNWFDENYIMKAYEIMNCDEKIGALGGRGIPVSDSVFPDWFESVQNKYACGAQLPQSGDASSRGYLWGAGLITRKSIMNKVLDPSFTLILTGRSGKNITAGDDTETCKRILLLGYSLRYSSDLVYKHYITNNRLTRNYLYELNNGIYESNNLILIYDKVLKMNNISFLNIIKELLKYSFKRFCIFFNIENSLKPVNIFKFFLLYIFYPNYREKYKVVKNFNSFKFH